MIKKRNIYIAASIIVATAGGAIAASSRDLGDMSLEMTRSDGGRARLVFLPHHGLVFQGVKVADVMTGHGTYTVSLHQFCYKTDFPGQECWILDKPLHIGDTVIARSTFGSLTAKLTLRNGGDAVIPANNG